MATHKTLKYNGNPSETIRREAGQIVLVFQGGGALGAYQAGVYRALHDAGIEPDWIIGTSIGAINAALIAGNAPENRLPALEAFWDRMTHAGPWHDLMSRVWMSPPAAYWATLFGGVPGFFKPNLPAFFGAHVPLGVDRAAYYSTEPLRRTLEELIEPGRLEKCVPRLTVGAAEVRTSRMRYFDSRDMPIRVDHIMASGALPPAFPAVRIDGELYWDGGILSNTPTEVIFDDNPRRNSLIFAVHMWNPVGEEPSTIWQVMHRHKDIQYSSRVASHIARQKQAHRLRHIITELAERLPDAALADAEVREMLAYGCLTRMHVVRLLSPSLDDEDQTKDVDFSKTGVQTRWQAGYDHARAALEHAPWRGEFDPLEGVILHEPSAPGEPQTPQPPADEFHRTGVGATRQEHRRGLS